MGGETDSIIERVIEYCRRVDREFRLKRVVLFGSRGRGDFYPHSDIDLLLVSDDFPDDWFTRQTKLYFLKLKQIEPIGYTTTEIRGMIDEGNKFIENVFREGKEIEPNKFRVRGMKNLERGRGYD
ncbi:MAG: nucleotidyltransferase domain-containing protein [Euryarchaeota archaeon]|nr:nucleotidyltransferase domain-containing protein [Euryarchaeota archaeon]